VSRTDGARGRSRPRDTGRSRDTSRPREASRSRSRSRTDPSRTIEPGLANTRTRLVGAREGVLADGVVGIVRAARFLSTGVRRAAARAATVVTPVGWVVAVVVPAAFAGGYLLGWTELVAVAWAGLVVVIVAVAALVGRNAFEIALALPHRRVVVGDPVTADIVVRNPARHRVLGVTAEVPVGDGLAAVAVPGLRRGGEFRSSFPIPTTRRGVVAVGPVRTVRADPIGLVRRELEWAERTELVVHPRTIAVPSTSTGLIRDLEGAATRDLTDSDVPFHALREYQPGDDRRYIHWKSTAKTGTYMVRQFEQTRRSHLVVALSLASADYAADEEFELAVSVAGSLGVRAIRDGRTVSVVVGEQTPEFARRRVLAVRPLATMRPARLLDDLAVVDTSLLTLGVRDLAHVAADAVTGISVAFLVCGSTPTPASLRAASAAFPPDVEVVAVVCDQERSPGLRRVAGLSVLTIGYLDDLRTALARSAAVA
jgi:uncharacterized protein (DUF58 family)